MISKDSKIYIAGHKGMVGSACWRILKLNGYNNLIGFNSNEIDLRVQSEVDKLISSEKPDVIIDAAAKVGGIFANKNNPYEFLMDNMLIQNNLIHSAHKNNIFKFIFLGSSCIYPKFAKQPLKEDYLLSGYLEETNEGYAIAKISGVKLIQYLRTQYKRDYISLMPTNLYGINDNFDLISSHVLPAMIRKFHEAKLKGQSKVVLWGSGNPMREFLNVDDLARAVIYAVENSLDNYLLNVGSGSDLSIKQLALLIQSIVGHTGNIEWDISKPDGTPKKLMDISKFTSLGWKPEISLEDGIQSTYNWFLKNY
jgi:GDP-L-fucose synthase